MEKCRRKNKKKQKTYYILFVYGCETDKSLLVEWHKWVSRNKKKKSNKMRRNIKLQCLITFFSTSFSPFSFSDAMALIVRTLNHISWFALSIWFYSNYYCLLNVMLHSQRHKTAIIRISGGKLEMKCSFLAHPRARFDAEFSLLQQILRITTKSFQRLKSFIFTNENRHERSRRFLFEFYKIV